MKAWLAGVLGTLLCVIGSTATAQPPQQQLKEGSTVVLVAAPTLVDTEYRQTVLLVAPLPGGGHIGLIVNRPTKRSLISLFPEHEPSKKVTEPVFFGGPMGISALTAAVTSQQSPGPGSVPLLPNVYLAVGVQTIDHIIEERPNDARYFLGHVGWRPGELRDEVDRGLWYVFNASPDIVFTKNVGTLWDEMMRQTKQVTAALDPSTDFALQY